MIFWTVNKVDWRVPWDHTRASMHIFQYKALFQFKGWFQHDNKLDSVSYYVAQYTDIHVYIQIRRILQNPAITDQLFSPID